MTPDPFLGEIRVFSAQRVQSDQQLRRVWLPCRGYEMPIRQNTALFSLLDKHYGGDGRVTYGIPNLIGNDPEAALIFCLAVEGIFPDVRDGATMEPAELLGQIKLFNRNRIPTDFMACRGQVLPISEHQQLFALVGARFGGDGQQTFALPNLDGNELDARARYAIAVRGPAPNMEELLAEW
jgi:microcystin-dependent protein